MAIVWLVLFILVSHFFLMQIFRFSTYHRYFFKSLPALILYSALVGYLFHRFGLSHGFIWYLVGEALLLASNWRKNERASRSFDEAFEANEEAASILRLSMANTRAYFFLSTTIHFVTYIIVFLYRYNTVEGSLP